MHIWEETLHSTSFYWLACVSFDSFWLRWLNRLGVSNVSRFPSLGMGGLSNDCPRIDIQIIQWLTFTVSCMCHGQKLDSHWARASTGRGRIACQVNRSSHVMATMRLRSPSCVQHAIQLSTANVPQQTIYNSQKWYMWFYGRYFCDCIPCCYLPTLVHAALLCLHGNLLEWLWFRWCHRVQLRLMIFPTGFFRGSSQWPVIVVSGDLQPLGALSEAELWRQCVWSPCGPRFQMEFCFRNRTGQLYLDAFSGELLSLDWCMTLNSLPQMISAKGYGCITLAKFDALFISRVRIVLLDSLTRCSS